MDKACFQQDMVHDGFKILARKNDSDKVLNDAAFNVGAFKVYKLLFRKLKESEIKSKVITFADTKSAKPRQELVNKLHKQIIKSFKN